jgi:hypothetical protein
MVRADSEEARLAKNLLPRLALVRTSAEAGRRALVGSRRPSRESVEKLTAFDRLDAGQAPRCAVAQPASLRRVLASI